MAKAAQKKAAERAREARRADTTIKPTTSLDNKSPVLSSENLPTVLEGSSVIQTSSTCINLVSDSDSEPEVSYEGGVNVFYSDSDDSAYQPGDSESEDEMTEDELTELEEEDLLPVIPIQRAEALFKQRTSWEWAKAEQKRNLGYTGTSRRTQQRKAQAARLGEAERTRAKAS